VGVSFDPEKAARQSSSLNLFLEPFYVGNLFLDSIGGLPSIDAFLFLFFSFLFFSFLFFSFLRSNEQTLVAFSGGATL